MRSHQEDEQPLPVARVERVDASTGGQAVGINYGTIQQNVFPEHYGTLDDLAISLDSLPFELGLALPGDKQGELRMFQGRKDLISQIDQEVEEAVARRKGRYLLIEAEAGVGKTALATFLAFTRKWPAHVVSLGRAPEVARANLAAQLVLKWSVGSEGILSAVATRSMTTERLQNLLVAASKRRDEVAPDRAVVILVDGLDEAPEALNGELPLGLPRLLPPGCVVVATCRPGIRLPAALGQVKRLEVEGSENLSDLDRYLATVVKLDEQIKASLARSGVPSRMFCARLAERARGVWIYATSVLEQIREGRSPRDVNSLPDGLAAYYADTVVSWSEAVPSWREYGMPILGILAALQAPAPSRSLAEWTGIPSSTVQMLVRGVLKPFLALRPGGDPDLYSIRHQSFREFCEGELLNNDFDALVREVVYDLSQETSTAHRKLLNSLLPSPDTNGNINWQEVSSYAREFLPYHAARATLFDEMVLNPGFLLSCSAVSLYAERHNLQTKDGLAALEALELALTSAATNGDPEEWLLAAAHLVRCEPLARTLSGQLSDVRWMPQRAYWRGVGTRQLGGHVSWVNAVKAVVLPEGSTVLASSDESDVVRLWEPLSGSLIREISTDSEPLREFSLYVDGELRVLLATAAEDYSIKVVDTHSEELVATFIGHDAPVTAISLTQAVNDRLVLASADEDGSVYLWDCSTGQQMGFQSGHLERVNILVWTRTGTDKPLLLSGGQDRYVRGWTLSDNESRILAESPVAVNAICAIPSISEATTEMIAVGGADPVIRLWNLADETLMHEWQGHNNWINALTTTTTPDGRVLLVSGGGDDSVRLWDLPSGRLAGQVSGHADAVTCLVEVPQVGSSNLVASGEEGATIKLWDPRVALNQTRGLGGHTGPVSAMTRVSLDSSTSLLATGGHDGTVEFWDVNDGRVVRKLTRASAPVRALTTLWMPNGRQMIIAACADNRIYQWDVLTGKYLWRGSCEIPKGPIALAAAVDYDLKAHVYLGGSDRGDIAVYRPFRNWVDEYILAPDGVEAMAVESIGRAHHLVTGNRAGTLRILSRTHKWAVSVQADAHDSPIRSVAVCPSDSDNLLIASGDDHGVINVWRWRTSWELQQTFPGHTGPVTALEFVKGEDASSEPTLVSGGQDQNLHIWNLESGGRVATLVGHTASIEHVVGMSNANEEPFFASSARDSAVITWRFR